MNLKTASQLCLALVAIALTGCGNKGLNSDKAAELISAYEPFHTSIAPVPGIAYEACNAVRNAYWSELSEAGLLSLSDVTTPAPKYTSYMRNWGKPSYYCIAEPTTKARGHYQPEPKRPMNWKWFLGTRTLKEVTNILMLQSDVAVVSFTYDTHRTDLAKSLVLLMNEHEGKADIRRSHDSWHLVSVNVAGIQRP